MGPRQGSGRGSLHGGKLCSAGSLSGGGGAVLSRGHSCGQRAAGTTPQSVHSRESKNTPVT